jgi:hypothetical protein
VLSTSEDGRVLAWDIVQAVMVRQYKVRVFCLAAHTLVHARSKSSTAKNITHASIHFSIPFPSCNQVFSTPVTSIDYHPHGRCRCASCTLPKKLTSMSPQAAVWCSDLPIFVMMTFSLSAFVCCGVDGMVKLFGKLGA